MLDDKIPPSPKEARLVSGEKGSRGDTADLKGLIREPLMDMLREQKGDAAGTRGCGAQD